MNKHDSLITELSRDLAPVPPAPDTNRLAFAWVFGSAAFVLTATHLLDPIRPGAFSQLVSEPRFLVESMLGVAAIVWISMMAFRDAIPAALSRQFAVAGLVLMTLWLTQYVIGLVSPAIEPSRLGVRNHCFIETLVYSIPPIFAGLIIIRRLYPLRFVRTAMSVSLAAGMLPALYMQFACMYEATHILKFHILPGLLMVLFGAAIAALWQKR